MLKKKIGKQPKKLALGEKEKWEKGDPEEDPDGEEPDSTDNEQEDDVVKEEDDDDNLDDDYGGEDDETKADYPEAEEGDESSCMYKVAYKNASDDEEPEEEYISDEEVKEKPKNQIVDNANRSSKKILFQKERVRVLGIRAKQLSMGAKPMLQNVEKYSPKEVAKLELANGVLPIIIERTFPDGSKERWKTSELKIVN